MLKTTKLSKLRVSWQLLASLSFMDLFHANGSGHGRRRPQTQPLKLVMFAEEGFARFFLLKQPNIGVHVILENQNLSETVLSLVGK